MSDRTSNPLPTWAECQYKKEAGATLSALEEFILECAPVPPWEDEFNRLLIAALQEQREIARQ